MGGPHIKLRAHVCMFCAHVFLACGASPNPSSSRSAFQPSEQRRLFQVLDCSQNVHLARIINAYETIPVIIFGKSALSSLRVWITYPLRSHDWASNEFIFLMPKKRLRLQALANLYSCVPHFSQASSLPGKLTKTKVMVRGHAWHIHTAAAVDQIETKSPEIMGAKRPLCATFDFAQSCRACDNMDSASYTSP